MALIYTWNGEVCFVMRTAGFWSNIEYLGLLHWNTWKFIFCLLHVICRTHSTEVKSTCSWSELGCCWQFELCLRGEYSCNCHTGDDFDQIMKIWYNISQKRNHIYGWNYYILYYFIRIPNTNRVSRRQAMYIYIKHWGFIEYPLLPWNRNKYYVFWVCVCSLNYPACNALVPRHFVICGMSSCSIVYHTVSRTTPFSWKKLLNTKYLFWFSLQFLFEIVLILKKIERDIAINLR